MGMTWSCWASCFHPQGSVYSAIIVQFLALLPLLFSLYQQLQFWRNVSELTPADSSSTNFDHSHSACSSNKCSTTITELPERHKTSTSMSNMVIISEDLVLLYGHKNHRQTSVLKASSFFLYQGWWLWLDFSYLIEFYSLKILNIFKL